jgi:hypothetical protein
MFKTAFTRVRKLPFSTLFILILRNSVKSLQLILNEFVITTNTDYTITAGAFSKARKKLKHTAYVELNNDIIDIYYKDNAIKRLCGFRVLACDGSKIRLPDCPEVKEKFGSIPIVGCKGKDYGEYSRATFQSCYDVLNNIAVQSILGHGSSYEVDLVEEMIGSLKADDLCLFDRGYASYFFMSMLMKEKKNFIIRCSKGSFSAVQKMCNRNAPTSMNVIIDVPRKQEKEIKKCGLPATLKIKLVRVVLSTGEIEVLATSLLDDTLFCEKDFNYLYSLRWGVETFFSKIKGRLALENFTGKTVESIYQDFWATIFISNIETIMTEESEEEMNANKQEGNKRQKINRAVSFNVIKNMAFELFFDGHDKNTIVEKLTQLFRMNPITVREGRKMPRREVSDTQSMHFQKRKRKHVF